MSVPATWKTGMQEVGPKIFAYVQATGETGISNAGLIVGPTARWRWTPSWCRP